MLIVDTMAIVADRQLLSIHMAKIDPEDLIDASEVAEILGVSSNRSVSTYRLRHDDFPAPVVEKGSGKCVLWLRKDIEVWRAKHPGRER